MATVSGFRMRLIVAASLAAVVWLAPAGGMAQCVEPPTGLVGWWPGEANASDIVGTNHGILRNGAGFAPGKVQQAFSLDGLDDRVEIPDSTDLRSPTLTVDVWVSFTALDGALFGGAPAGLQYVVFKRNSRFFNFEGYTLLKFRTPEGDRLGFGVASAEGVQNGVLSSTLVVPNRFYHVAGTYDGSTVRLYVDGVLEGSSLHGFPLDLSTDPLMIGGSGQPHFDAACNCIVDEVELYNRALTAEEVAAIFAAGAAGKCTATTVAIDIKPGSVPNSINLGAAGSVPVAILSDATFDALTVDPLSVTLAGANISLRGRGTPMASLEDVNGDGLLDLVVHVETAALQLSQGDIQATLEGRTVGGTPIAGVDTVRIVP